MTRPTRAPKGSPAAKDKRNFTIWTKTPMAERIDRAVASASRRAGYPVSTSAWLLAQVTRAVEEEERRSAAEEAPGNGKKEGGRKT